MYAHCHSRRGAVVPLAALLMVVLLGMVSFVVDIGYITKSQQELQTAADAAALAGTMQLMSRSALSGSSYNASSVTSSARTAATNCAALNKSAGVSVTLLSADATPGYIANPSSASSPFVTSNTP